MSTPSRLAGALVPALGLASGSDPSAPEEVLSAALLRCPAPTTLGTLLDILESTHGEAGGAVVRDVIWAVQRRAALDPEHSLERLARVFLEAPAL